MLALWSCSAPRTSGFSGISVTPQQWGHGSEATAKCVKQGPRDTRAESHREKERTAARSEGSSPWSQDATAEEVVEDRPWAPPCSRAPTPGPGAGLPPDSGAPGLPVYRGTDWRAHCLTSEEISLMSIFEDDIGNSHFFKF